MEAVWALVGVILGGLAVWLLLRGRVAEAAAAGVVREELSAAKVRASESDRLQAKVDASEEQIVALKAERAALETRYEEQAKNLEEQRSLVAQAKTDLADTFKALSADTLTESRAELKKDADEVLKPVREQLDALRDANSSMDVKRAEAYADIQTQIASLAQQQAGFKTEADKLARALQDSGAAGNWGEMLLERVLEKSGLQEGIHFEVQVSTTDEEGRKRPDVVVNMPGGRTIVVDSKAPLQSHLSALDTTDPKSRETLLRDHAKKLADHAKALGARGYSRRTDTTDFVVLFVPSEAAFRSAFEARPELVEESIQHGVFIVTPITLLALLRAVAFGWRQEQATREAKTIQELGQKLYESVGNVIGHYEAMGRGLRQAVGAFNKLGGSIDGHLVSRARRMKELGVQAASELSDAEPIEFSPRAIAAIPDEAVPAGLFESDPLDSEPL